MSYSSMVLVICSLVCGSCKLAEKNSRVAVLTKEKKALFNNVHDGDESLAGVILFQMPNSPEDAEGFSETSHPAEVDYFFWNGTTHAVEYDPHGKVIGSVWDDSARKSGLMHRSDFWRDVDFSWGSDHDFSSHPNHPLATGPPG